MRVDANLDTICSKEFTHPDTLAANQPGALIDYRFTCIRETWDKGFLLSGYYNPGCNTNNTERSYLLKLDSLFNVEWIKKYSNIGISFNVETTADSGCYFVSISQVNQIYKYDKLGNLEWQVNTNLSPPYVGSSGPVDLKVYDQNTLYVASGYWVEPVYGRRGFLLSKVDIPTRTVVWEKYFIMFNHIDCFTLHQHIRLLIASDGNLIVCANSVMPNPTDSSVISNKGFIAKLNPNGDSLWARHLGYGDFEFVNQINDIIITDDGGFLTVGFFTDWHPGIMYEDAWIVKTDSLGCDTPGCHIIGVEELKIRNEKLEMFPNPFGEEIHISLPEEFGGGMFVMYDWQGRRAVETTVPESYGKQTFTIQTTNLKPGMYLVELSGDDGMVWRRKVVKD
ncbi:MAG TPA: T9SS type A sorting domain-containing protein [Bacteroidales bacterium]|nr:T9SS type A sorting domain-containing protein [Bacteroidales bacterium]HRZ49621.1 T9SS type A sorting domain-containing protein [Bacteroidales bacterium]